VTSTPEVVRFDFSVFVDGRNDQHAVGVQVKNLVTLAQSERFLLRQRPWRSDPFMYPPLQGLKEAARDSRDAVRILDPKNAWVEDVALVVVRKP
jgi:hypothetical protein